MYNVLLGVAGDLCHPEECSHYSTRVGGQPALPGTAAPQQLPQLLCQLCGKALALLLQAYAPLPADAALSRPEAPERCLYVFVCTAPGCGQHPSSFKVIRCQLLPPQQHQSTCDEQPSPLTSIHNAAPHSQASCVAASLASACQPHTQAGYGSCNGFDDADWGTSDAQGSWGESNNPAVAPSAFDLSDLDAALDELGQVAHNSKPSHRKTAAAANDVDVDTSAAAAPSCLGPASSYPLPSFYIEAHQEPAGDATSMKELEHIQQLLTQYQQGEEAAGRPPPSLPQQPLASSSTSRQQRKQRQEGNDESDSEESASQSGEGAGSDAGVSWAGEQWEEDAARGVSSEYLKFNKRLQRSPQQCVRYCPNGPVLWPSKAQPQPPPCPRCGAPRVFELQLMAPLCAVLLECADWLEAEDLRVCGPGINAAANWDWVTVAVYTCSRSCSALQQDSAQPTSQHAMAAQQHRQPHSSAAQEHVQHQSLMAHAHLQQSASAQQKQHEGCMPDQQQHGISSCVTQPGYSSTTPQQGMHGRDQSQAGPGYADQGEGAVTDTGPLMLCDVAEEWLCLVTEEECHVPMD